MPSEGHLPVDDPIEVAPGAVIEIPEWGYCFGSGTLVLEVQWAGPAYVRAGARWRQVKGRTVHWNGDRTDRHPVEVRLDAVRVPKQRRRT
jgi:hypothetical protein